MNQSAISIPNDIDDLDSWFEAEGRRQSVHVNDSSDRSMLA